MRIVKPSAKIISSTPKLEKLIELAGRVCWKSEGRITEDSYKPFIESIKAKAHESVLEHGAISVRFIVDRGISHELVRHRVASFSQESTRYCSYNKEKFSGHVSFVDPRGGFPTMGKERFALWKESMRQAEKTYFALLELQAAPQEARNVLPNSLKTELVVTANPREWRHIFKMRTATGAHPQMREIMIPLLAKFKAKWPSLFGDIDAN